LARRLASTVESLTIASHTLLRAVSRKGRVCGMGGCTGSTCLKNAESLRLLFNAIDGLPCDFKLYPVFYSGTASVLPGCVECCKVR